MRQAQAGFFPTVTANLSRDRGSSRTVTNANNNSAVINTASTQTTYSTGVAADWTLDIWGQIRRTVEGNKASAQASAAALAAARLSAQATLATDYFELRAQDQLQRLLDDTVAAEQLSLKITQSRYRFGVAAKADVVSAEAQLLSVRRSRSTPKIQRALLEHAIAVLIGKQPADFSLRPVALRSDVPTVPAGVPSRSWSGGPTSRRPSARWPPPTHRSASPSRPISEPDPLGFRSVHEQRLDAPDQLAQPRVVGRDRRSRRRSSTAERAAPRWRQARAAYEQDVATYRQTVLTGSSRSRIRSPTLRILEQQSVGRGRSP